MSGRFSVPVVNKGNRKESPSFFQTCTQDFVSCKSLIKQPILSLVSISALMGVGQDLSELCIGDACLLAVDIIHTGGILNWAS